MLITRGLVNAKVRSDKLYGFIVRYFEAVGLDERTKANVTVNTPIFFFYSLAKAYPALSDSTAFFEIVNSYIMDNVAKLDDKQCETLFDTWKHNQNFIGEQTKAALVERRLVLKSEASSTISDH